MSQSTISRACDTLDDVKTTLVERGATHGDADSHFKCVAALWSAYLSEATGRQVTLTQLDVLMMMDLLKTGRVASTPRNSKVHPDHVDDKIGYMALASTQLVGNTADAIAARVANSGVFKQDDIDTERGK